MTVYFFLFRHSEALPKNLNELVLFIKSCDTSRTLSMTLYFLDCHVTTFLAMTVSVSASVTKQSSQDFEFNHYFLDCLVTLLLAMTVSASASVTKQSSQDFEFNHYFLDCLENQRFSRNDYSSSVYASVMKFAWLFRVCHSEHRSEFRIFPS